MDIKIDGPMRTDYDEILSAEARAFVANLANRFAPRIDELLAARAARREELRAGKKLDFLKETESVRAGDWKVAPLPDALIKRVVEITGPVDRKMVINALNSGSDCFMADFEDSSSPTWDNMVRGQINLRDAARRDIRFTDPSTGKNYQLNDEIATLLVRPRGLHLREKHFLVNGRPIPGSLFDFGLYLFHNAKELETRGLGPYYYLAKLESHLEARMWNDVFRHAQEALGIPVGTIKATVLVETLPAAFEMDEILYELREHSSGLNCGRWDYIFSFIKMHRWRADCVLPDRSQITMEQPFMRAYTQLAVRTCHRRGVHAMGGMAAQIPIRNDPEASQAAIEKVRADKRREVNDGHDGTWVAHPGLVVLAREAFEEKMTGPNQLDRLREDVEVSADDLLKLPTGTRTEQGLRWNIRVGIQYLESWLRGTGCVPLYHLMEDAATAEISRAQVWQWLTHGATVDRGPALTPDRVEGLIDEEMEAIAGQVGIEAFQNGCFDEARELFARLCFSEEMDEFLTLSAYDMLDRTARNED